MTCACKKPKPTEVIGEQSQRGPDAWRLIVRYVLCDKCGLEMAMLPKGGS